MSVKPQEESLVDFYSTPWQEYKIPHIQDSNYGLSFPEGTSQLAVELKCFNIAWKGLHTESDKVESAYNHGLRIAQMLWPTGKMYSIWTGNDPDLGFKDYVEIFKIYTDEAGDTHKIFNDYFLKVFRFLCSGKHVCLTGPASSAKTYTTAIYSLICFYSAPHETTIMISTTSAASSERRVWADIKSLHRNAKFNIWNMNPIGEVIEYLKALVFDFDKEMSDGDSKKAKRDFRNAINVIPIPDDSKAEGALDTIMGTKNEVVIWVIDELPAMREGVDRPRNNIGHNPYFQFVGIGNANSKTDSHGNICEPKIGWDNILMNTHRVWNGATALVLFLHGEESPNDNPIINAELITKKRDYPFPYLSNKIARDDTALNAGRGDLNHGKKTIDYLRFAIGFWYGSDATATILSSNLIRKYGGDSDPDPWDHIGPRVFAGLDPAFTTGGDDNQLCFLSSGRSIYGRIQIVWEFDSFSINPIADDKEEYRDAVAGEVARLCKERGTRPEDLFVDIGNDGGLMIRAINMEMRTNKVQGVSSLGVSRDPEQYLDVITQYWFQVADFAQQGLFRGFNVQSGYAKDLFSRQYQSMTKKVVRVEKKSDMKKRIKRSPDAGDSAVYALEGIRRAGIAVIRSLGQKEKDNLDQMEKNPWSIDTFQTHEDSDFAFTKEYSY